mmetsp:Transcript_113262/g.305677  ORF Transcript_113262/g.305677 Transcript_113262/m.305677 type:complete len:200 (+) Transcript_113262:126-725(+)
MRSVQDLCKMIEISDGGCCSVIPKLCWVATLLCHTQRTCSGVKALRLTHKGCLHARQFPKFRKVWKQTTNRCAGTNSKTFLFNFLGGRAFSVQPGTEHLYKSQTCTSVLSDVDSVVSSLSSSILLALGLHNFIALLCGGGATLHANTYTAAAAIDATNQLAPPHTAKKVGMPESPANSPIHAGRGNAMPSTVARQARQL